ELYDVVSIQLGLPRRGAEHYQLEIELPGDGTHRVVGGTVTNLSIDGVRLVVPEKLGEGSRLRVKITCADGEILRIGAKVLWAQPRDGHTVVGAQFDTLDDKARDRLARLTQWEIVDDT